MDPLTDDQILQMFRDFGLGSEGERRRFLSEAQLETMAGAPGRAQVFIRVESTTSPREGRHAELA